MATVSGGFVKKKEKNNFEHESSRKRAESVRGHDSFLHREIMLGPHELLVRTTRGHFWEITVSQ